MEDAGIAARATGRAPWHLWAVGIPALLWYVAGAVTIQLAQAGDVPGLGPGEVAYYAAKPAWLVATTAIGTYGSVFGTGLLLLRRKASVAAFAVALAAIVLTDAAELANGTARAYANPAAAVATAVIAVIAGLMTLYSQALRRRGQLR